jgi:hypothetical protein
MTESDFSIDLNCLSMAKSQTRAFFGFYEIVSCDARGNLRLTSAFHSSIQLIASVH